MKTISTSAAVLLAATCIFAISLTARANNFQNGSFEDPIGAYGAPDAWGQRGEVSGEPEAVESVEAGEPGQPQHASDGSRVLRINLESLPANGIWQQVNWKPEGDVHFAARYLIQGGNLPAGVETGIRIQFFGEEDHLISAEVGSEHTDDTHGQWESDEISAVTPAGTTYCRFIIMAGGSGGEAVTNQIYWDDAVVEGDAN